MALSGSVLGALIQTNMEAVSPPVSTDPPVLRAYRLALYTAIADAIVSHITSAAQVAVASVGGVTVGVGVSGPGTGSIL